MGKTTFIYALCEPNSRTVRYIGKANDLKRRFREHLKKSMAYDTYLGRWLRSLNGEKPSLVVLREVPVEQWEIAEERYIRLGRGLGMRLVNTSDGGEGVSMIPEICQKISKTMTGTPKTPAHRAAIAAGKLGDKNPCFGKIYTVEEREKRSAQSKGEKSPFFGRKLPPEQKAQISATLTGKVQSSETRAKRSASLRAFYDARRDEKV